jgi:hypothetical protein
MTALELRMAVSAVHPSILLRTDSRERAEQAADVLAARGVRAVAVDLADVPALETMVHVRHLVVETTGIRADTQGPTLAYDAMAAIVRAAVETSVWRTTREHESTVSVRGTRVQWEVERTRTEHAIEQVLFLFVRDQGVPWVLRAGEARYQTLGAGLRPTVIENFMATLALLRDRAPRAIYDERFVAHPLVRKAETRVRGHDTVSPGLEDEGIEVRVHLLAQALGRPSLEGPYR